MILIRLVRSSPGPPVVLLANRPPDVPLVCDLCRRGRPTMITEEVDSRHEHTTTEESEGGEGSPAWADRRGGNADSRRPY
jgi:hypothetical protein